MAVREGGCFTLVWCVVCLPYSCGYATVHNVLDMSLEDRMESFFLSETCKYLYLVSSAQV